MKVTVNRSLLEKRTALIESNVEKGNLIKALKDDDEKKAKDAFGALVRNSMKYSSPQSELQMTAKEFGDFKNAIFNGDLEVARKLFGVTKPGPQQTTATHNPITGKPWSSGPVQNKVDLTNSIAASLFEIIEMAGLHDLEDEGIFYKANIESIHMAQHHFIVLVNFWYDPSQPNLAPMGGNLTETKDPDVIDALKIKLNLFIGDAMVQEGHKFDRQYKCFYEHIDSNTRLNVYIGEHTPTDPMIEPVDAGGNSLDKKEIFKLYKVLQKLVYI